MVSTNQWSYSVSKYRILKDYLDFYQMRYNKLPSLFLNYPKCLDSIKTYFNVLLLRKHENPSHYFGLNKKKYSCYQLKYIFLKSTLSPTKNKKNHQVIRKIGKKNVPIKR